MIVKPWIDLKDGIMFVGYIKFWKNDLKLSLLTNSEGVIDSMSEQLMELFEISGKDEIKQTKYKITWFLSHVG